MIALTRHATRVPYNGTTVLLHKQVLSEDVIPLTICWQSHVRKSQTFGNLLEVY